MLYRKRGKSKRMRSRSEMKNKLPATFVLLKSRIQQTTRGRGGEKEEDGKRVRGGCELSKDVANEILNGI